MEHVERPYLFIFKNYKDTVQILLFESAGVLSIPRGRGNLSEDHLNQCRAEFDLEPLVVQLDASQIHGLTGRGIIVNRPQRKVKPEGEGGRETDIHHWAHPRKLQVIVKNREMRDLFDLVLDWIIDQDFAAGFLSNNLQKLKKYSRS